MSVSNIVLAPEGKWSPRSSAARDASTAAVRAPNAGFGGSLMGWIDARRPGEERRVSAAALPPLTDLFCPGAVGGR